MTMGTRSFAGFWGAVLLVGCPPGNGNGDAGSADDAGGAPLSCETSASCKQAGSTGVCRNLVCVEAPCASDTECSLAEKCQGGKCTFTGCAQNTDCPSGVCKLQSFSCAECSSSAHCPADRPVCDANRCIGCKTDGDCQGAAGAYCDPLQGTCVFCTQDAQCPTGLWCGADRKCHGAKKGETCPAGTVCDVGLLCLSLQVGSALVPTCLEACRAYSPTCPNGEYCMVLHGSNSSDPWMVVFENGEPLGYCHTPQPGLKLYREACTGAAATCQQNLECVPDTASTAVCRAFCDPISPKCPTGEICHRFPGDAWGREYGLCYADNGYQNPCTRDSECKSGLSCSPGENPAAPSNFSNYCHFAGAGTSTAMAPCLSNLSCLSGFCRADTARPSSPYVCYGACDQDDDCQNVGGRSGLCVGKFDFNSTHYPSGGDLAGCTPFCSSDSTCTEYGVGYRCQVEVKNTVTPPASKLVQYCAVPTADGGVGDPCSSNSTCESDFCLRKDGRGVNRKGFCSAPCSDQARCLVPDGGVMKCTQTPILASSGDDGKPNTGDDRHLLPALCGGLACTSDQDCAPPLGTCTLDVHPPSLLSGLATFCRADSLGGTLPGGDTSCTRDNDCVSGVCASRKAPATGKVCFRPCVVGSGAPCPGGTSCVQDGVEVSAPDGTLVNFTACVPP